MKKLLLMMTILTIAWIGILDTSAKTSHRRAYALLNCEYEKEACPNSENCFYHHWHKNTNGQGNSVECPNGNQNQANCPIGNECDGTRKHQNQQNHANGNGQHHGNRKHH